MRRYVEVISTCAIAALAVTPAFGQSGGTSSGATGPAAPTQDQRRPDTPQPGMSGPGPTQPGMTQPEPNRPGAREDAVKGTRDQDTAKGQPDMKGKPHMNRDMSKSANAGQIRRIQEQLKAQGHDPGPIDGVMGPQTEQALRSYQKQENLPETGQLDQETLGKLGIVGKTSQRR
jgi:hypothetical protein